MNFTLDEAKPNRNETNATAKNKNRIQQHVLQRTDYLIVKSRGRATSEDRTEQNRGISTKPHNDGADVVGVILQHWTLRHASTDHGHGAKWKFTLFRFFAEVYRVFENVNKHAPVISHLDYSPIRQCRDVNRQQTCSVTVELLNANGL